MTPNDAIAFGNTYSEGSAATHLQGDLTSSGVFDPSDAIAFANSYYESLPPILAPAAPAALAAAAPSATPVGQQRGCGDAG